MIGKRFLSYDLLIATGNIEINIDMIQGKLLQVTLNQDNFMNIFHSRS